MVMLLTTVLDAPELLLGQLGPAQPRKVLLDLVLVVEAGHQRPAPGGVVQTFELVVVKVVLLGVVVHEAVKWRSFGGDHDLAAKVNNLEKIVYFKFKTKQNSQQNTEPFRTFLSKGFTFSKNRVHKEKRRNGSLRGITK